MTKNTPSTDRPNPLASRPSVILDLEFIKNAQPQMPASAETEA